MQGPSGRGTGHSRCGRRCDQPSASGGEAWSMAGQARRRRSALAALCVPRTTTFTGVRLPALTWAPFTSTSGGLRQVYLYLRPPTPALPLPAPPPSEPRSVYRVCAKVSVAELREAMGGPLNAHSATASLARAAPTGGRCARPASSRCTTRPQRRSRIPLVASGSRWLDERHPLGKDVEKY